MIISVKKNNPPAKASEPGRGIQVLWSQLALAIAAKPPTQVATSPIRIR